MRGNNGKIERKLRGVRTAVIAEMYDLSEAYLKKDRITKRVIPFFKIGDLVRYDPDRVHAVLLANEEGGLPMQAPKAPGRRSAPTPKVSV